MNRFSSTTGEQERGAEESTGVYEAPEPNERASAPREQVSAQDPLVGSRRRVEVAPRPTLRRIARQKITVYAAPSRRAPVRGRIPMAAAFDVLGDAQGDECESGWADLGNHGFACMDATRLGDRAPLTLPKMRAGHTPFHYARVRSDGHAPRYQSLRSMHAGERPTGALRPGVHYAFAIRRRAKGEVVLIDVRGRVVREADVVRFRPSRFEGRDLERRPLSAGEQLAWVISWPEASSYAGLSTEADLVRQLGYHEEVTVSETETPSWYRLVDGAFIESADIRVFERPPQRPSSVGSTDIWIDVELESQILAVMRGEEAIFATLVSSGSKDPTPRGIYRIHNKLAVGSMGSSPDADDFYDVQAVPHIQYFAGSYALHSAYWHDYFGRPISHGCVNLSPRDARHVFSLTTPTLPPGWVHAYESNAALGTTVRIRKGAEAVRDRRAAVEPLFGR